LRLIRSQPIFSSPSISQPHFEEQGLGFREKELKFFCVGLSFIHSEEHFEKKD
jgi:hypothetical protein